MARRRSSPGRSQADSRPSAEAIAAQGGRKIPDIIVEVLPGNTVNGPATDTRKAGGFEPHGPGDRLELEGPTAIALVQGGHVKIVGSTEP